MVQHSLPQVHQKASARIPTWNLVKNDQGSNPLNAFKTQRQEIGWNQFQWDKLIEGAASLPKDGGGVKIISILSQTQPILTIEPGYREIFFISCSATGEFEVWTLAAEATLCFFGVSPWGIHDGKFQLSIWKGFREIVRQMERALAFPRFDSARPSSSREWDKISQTQPGSVIAEGWGWDRTDWHSVQIQLVLTIEPGILPREHPHASCTIFHFLLCHRRIRRVDSTYAEAALGIRGLRCQSHHSVELYCLSLLIEQKKQIGQFMSWQKG
jgi:hypothetical protein